MVGKWASNDPTVAAMALWTKRAELAAKKTKRRENVRASRIEETKVLSGNSPKNIIPKELKNRATDEIAISTSKKQKCSTNQLEE